MADISGLPFGPIRRWRLPDAELVEHSGSCRMRQSSFVTYGILLRHLLPYGNTSMAADRHVALLIETSRSYGRGLLRGIIRYQREHGPWSIYFEPRGVNDS